MVLDVKDATCALNEHSIIDVGGSFYRIILASLCRKIVQESFLGYPERRFMPCSVSRCALVSELVETYARLPGVLWISLLAARWSCVTLKRFSAKAREWLSSRQSADIASVVFAVSENCDLIYGSDVWGIVQGAYA